MISQARIPLAAAAALALFSLAACEDSDTIPPPGSTIEVSGNPTTIVLGSVPECQTLLQQANCGTAEVVATVSNALGVPLPGQDVRFTSTAGLLFVGTLQNATAISNLPVETDGFGNARVNLITTSTTTVSARSGAATNNLTFNTVQGNLSQIILTTDPNDSSCNSTTVTDCNQDICFIATAFDTSAQPLSGVTIIFSLQNNDKGGNLFNGTFIPSQALTDSNGEVATLFTSDSTCPNECSIALGGGPCMAEVIASTLGGGFQSTAVSLFINIP
ncbi:MAG: hypothetical protein O7A63_09640 [Acidobacteria bacterium]|nr:hypothetical protein [Acidobacteriota bacterium]